MVFQQQRNAHVRRDEREEACGPITGILESPFSPALIDLDEIGFVQRQICMINIYRADALLTLTA
jgi:hypothetical protein